MLFLAVFLAPQSDSTHSFAYIDPALSGMSDQNVSVIVTAVSSETAAAAVQSVGGTITTDLWLINAAGALVDANRIESLAAAPGIVSIVKNSNVGTTEGPPGNDNGNGNGSGNGNSGYVTNRRIGKGAYILPEKQLTPVVSLPDGGFASINEKGGLLIINADGSERTSVKLSTGGPYYSAPVVGEDGTIYLAGEGKRIYAVSAQGEVIWSFQEAGEKFRSGATLSPDETILYVVDEKRTIYALNSTTGKQLWKFKPGGDGNVLASPTIAADGTLFVVTEKGYLYAIQPNGTVAWSYQANGGSPYKQSPVLSNSGTVFIAGEDKTVVAVNAANGAQQYKFVANSKILARPVVDASGNLYVAAEDRALYSIAPTGAVRFSFRPLSGKFKTSPALSPDGSIVYIAVEEQVLYAVDTTTGNSLWQYATAGKITSAPAVDNDGSVIIGSEGFDLSILNASGTPVYRHTFSEGIHQTPISDAANNMMVLVGDQTLVMLGMLPEVWDGRPDVIATDSKWEYELVNPVSIDVGADIVQDGLASGNPVTGEGVTIAVIDTGVYFSHEVKGIMGSQVQKDFVGQADFVSSTCPIIEVNNDKVETEGIQFQEYCFQNADQSRDGYGHGSHVAGIIWNDFSDANTGVPMGIAPDAKILSVRVLGDDGTGTYEDVINGIQYVVANKDLFNVRIINMSLSGYATTPYFVNPLNRAVEAAWAQGLVVLAAAGNIGDGAQSVTVPGNDPYVITVGAINSNRTPGYWADDFIPTWSSAGPTLDGFVKPDVLAPGANIVSFMYNDPNDMNNSAFLVQQHPDFSATASLFRMNGTSMSTAVASGVVALMLDAHPDLSPDQVKFRLMASAVPAVAEDGNLTYSPLQQGAGRIWAPEAVWGSNFPADGIANAGMDINEDLSNGWMLLDDSMNPVLDSNGNPLFDEAKMAFHYQGNVRRVTSDDGQVYLYYITNPVDDTLVVLGAADVDDMSWIDQATLSNLNLTFVSNDQPWAYNEAWAGGIYNWAGGIYNWAGGIYNWAGGIYNWAGGIYNWAGGIYNWAGGIYNWAGGIYNWAGGIYNWAGGIYNWAGGIYNWAGGIYNWAGSEGATISSTTWIEND